MNHSYITNVSAEIQSVTLAKSVTQWQLKITNVKRSLFSLRRTFAAVVCLVQTAMVSLPASWNKWLTETKCTAVAYPWSSKTTVNNIFMCPGFHFI